MAMAKAVVAHPIACEGINVRHNYNVLLAEDDSMFIEYIDLLLSMRSKREDLGNSARRLMEDEYGFHAIGKQLSDAFNGCKLLN